MGAITMGSIATLTTGIKMFGDVSDKRNDNHASTMKNKYDKSTLRMDNSIKNHTITLDILENKYEAEQIRTKHSYDMYQYDYKNLNTVANREVEFISSGVELSGSAAAVLNGIENQVITERESRVQLKNHEALKREIISNNLLREINYNNILTDYNIKIIESEHDNKMSSSHTSLINSLGNSFGSFYKEIYTINNATQKANLAKTKTKSAVTN